MVKADGSTARIPTVSTLAFPRFDRALPTARPATGNSSRIQHQTYRDAAVDGKLEIADVAWIQVARITAGRHRVVHEPAPSVTASVSIALQVTGRSIIEQVARTVRLTPGHWCVCNLSQRYVLSSPAASQRLVILIPRSRIEASEDLERVSMRALAATSGVSRLAFGAASSLIEELAAINADRIEDLAESVCRLINLAMHERARYQPPEAARASLSERIRAYVSDHLRDPELCLDSIAKHLNASKRSLHRAVRDANESIHELIWRERLERCRRDLLDPAKMKQTITDIAQSWGFKNLTHFSRAFRARFGVTARDARRTVLVVAE